MHIRMTEGMTLPVGDENVYFNPGAHNVNIDINDKDLQKRLLELKRLGFAHFELPEGWEPEGEKEKAVVMEVVTEDDVPSPA